MIFTDIYVTVLLSEKNIKLCNKPVIYKKNKNSNSFVIFIILVISKIPFAIIKNHFLFHFKYVTNLLSIYVTELL